MSAFVAQWRGTFGAAVIALLAEAALLIAAALWLTRHSSAPVADQSFGPIQLDLTTLPTPEPPPQEPEQPSGASASEPAPTPDASSPPPEPPSEEPTVPRSDLPAKEAPSPPVAPRRYVRDLPPAPLPDLSLLPRRQAAVGLSRPAPPNANGDAAQLTEFVERLNAALRSASVYPKEARGLKLTGRVLVRVHYRDGKVWDPSIIRSSGFAVLDKAVLEGVVRAVWPPPPRGYEGRELVVPINGAFW
ncbi:energy transducer TonB [Methylosinus sp. Sm6]|uniref:energy transducer TonB n=1 Tax=Methylosinus sp. Sm6 TaxID=2866948 RepID=UPI001C995CC9|nr:energy transducer TonB [Methylosinus sp. Sm6]MBY6239690.1 TonB family protein [Methylosinus sp. Sm6]